MKKEVAIIGGGTAGLFLAAFLDPDKYVVTIYEKMNTLGRKFLVAGDGGFNLTHGEEMPSFKSRYTPTDFLEAALESFTNSDLRTWLSDLGIPTFVGSSGRVFPKKGIKPIEVLRTIKTYLEKRGVQFKFNQTFVGWDTDDRILFDAEEVIDSDYTIFALGGSSWKVTGSDGSWKKSFEEKRIPTVEFNPSNCAYKINWSEQFTQKHEGAPLKNIAISIKDKTQKGEAVITKFGLEGNAIYALSPDIKVELKNQEASLVSIDFKPSLDQATVLDKLNKAKTNTTKTLKEILKLPSAVIDLIKEDLSKEEFLDNSYLASSIKRFPLTLLDDAPIDEAISTSGGVALEAVDKNFQLKKLDNQFCIGEMLDWDAPTGGYLIQACASSGVFLAKHLNRIE